MKTKAVLAYLTTGGNTRHAAEYLASQMSAWAEVEALPINEVEANPQVLADASIVGVGGPVFHLRLAQRAMRLIQAQVADTPTRTQSFFIFCSYAGISSGLALLSPATILKRAGYPILGALKLKAPHFYQSDAVFPDAEARATMSEFAAELKKRSVQEPRQKDLMKALDYQRPLVKILHKVIPAFSNRRVPEIEMSSDQCRGCGLCARRCPAGAISMQDGVPNIDAHECMHCYHCISVCEAGALHYDEQKLRKIVAFNRRVLGQEKPATAFI